MNHSIRYIIIDKASAFNGRNVTVDLDGKVVVIPNLNALSVNWGQHAVLLLGSWSIAANLKAQLKTLAIPMDTSPHEYRCFVHYGQGQLVGADPQGEWKNAAYLEGLREALSEQLWGRPWSRGGSSGKSFSTIIESFVDDVSSKSLPVLPDIDLRLKALHKAWDEATEYYGWKPRLMQGVLQMLAIADPFVGTAPDGWDKLGDSEVGNIVDRVLSWINADRNAAIGDLKGKALYDALEAIKAMPSDGLSWQAFVAAYDALK